MKKVILLVSVLVILTGLLVAQAPMHEKRMMGKQDQMMNKPGDDMEACFDQLNLTKDQEMKMKDMRAEMQKFMIKTGADIKILRIDMQKAIVNDDFDGATKLAKQINSKELEISLNRLDHHKKVLAILTADQKAKMKEFMNDRPGHKMGKHGKGMGAGKENCEMKEGCGMDKGCEGQAGCK